MREVRRVGKERSLFGRRNDGQPELARGFRIVDAGGEQIVGIAVTFERARYPETVYVHVPVRVDGTPSVLGGDIFYKALAALDRPQKDQTVIEPLGEPCFFARDLNIFVVRDRTADMLSVQVFFCDADVFHTYYISRIRQNLQAMKKNN